MRRPLALVRAALRDLFDQDTAFGRLAMVQVAMLAGDTLITISLADTLFFSNPAKAAEGKVLLYLLLTVAPFAVVSPLLGPLIDASRGARRLLVFASAVGRVVLCVLMARSVHSLLLFPEALCALVLSKLYLVTRGALVPEMARADQLRAHPEGVDDAGWPLEGDDQIEEGFAGFNAQLTLLGTVAGFAISLPGLGILRLLHSPGVLVFAAMVFCAAAFGATRLPSLPRRRRDEADAEVAEGGHTGPIGDREVVLGLTASATIRLTSGFLTFLLAFGLRRHHAGLYWYGVALAATGVGALLGLYVVRRLRRHLSESSLLTGALLLVGVGGVVAAVSGGVPAQAGLALVAAVAGAIAQPSFDALTQRHVPPGSQGRVFARLAVRQQLTWVLGAFLSVAIPMPFVVGDGLIAGVSVACALGYSLARLAKVRAAF